MILAEKENLKAETAVEVLRLREHEMSYYSQSISLMATQATLLAGFTFAMLAATDPVLPGYRLLSDYGMEQIGLKPSEDDTFNPRGILEWTWLIWVANVFNLIGVCVTVMGLATQLWTCQACVTVSILAAGLALRGPPGSADKSVRLMARENRRLLRMFSRGLKLFGLSVVYLLGSTLEAHISVPSVVAFLLITNRMHRHEELVHRMFYLHEDLATAANFGAGQKKVVLRTVRPDKAGFFNAVKELPKDGVKVLRDFGVMTNPFKFPEATEIVRPPTPDAFGAFGEMGHNEEIELHTAEGDAVNIIMAHERRQAEAAAKLQQRWIYRQVSRRGSKVEATKTIQRYFRGADARRRLARGERRDSRGRWYASGRWRAGHHAGEEQGALHAARRSLWPRRAAVGARVAGAAAEGARGPRSRRRRAAGAGAGDGGAASPLSHPRQTRRSARSVGDAARGLALNQMSNVTYLHAAHCTLSESLRTHLPLPRSSLARASGALASPR